MIGIKPFTRFSYIFMLSFVGAIASYTPALLAQDIVISVTQQAHKNYQKLLNDRPCFQVDDYLHPHAYRGSLELLIICKALTIGGIQPNFIYKPIPNYSRALIETEKGNVAVMAESAWLTNINTDLLYKTDPVFQSGEYIKGLFTTQDRLAAIEAKIAALQSNHQPALSAVQTLVVASSSNWLFDWSLLKALNLVATNVPTTQNMCQMIKHNRADVILTDLIMSGSTGIHYHCAGTLFYPIKGVKITFKQTRHFVIAKAHPQSLVIFNALQKGLKQLRQQGDLQKMFFPTPSNTQLIGSWEDIAKNLSVYF